MMGYSDFDDSTSGNDYHYSYGYDSCYDGNDYDSDSECQDKVEKLKNLREKVNWEIEQERCHFFKRILRLTRHWKYGRLPNLREIFRPKEIDWLLTKVIKENGTYPRRVKLIKFVIRTGYKDEPELDEDGKPILCRTTPVHWVTKYHRYSIIPDLFQIYDRFDVNYIDDDSGLTHFHVACEYGSDEVVVKFLDLGQDPNCLTQESDASMIDPPLLVALKHDRKEVVELLLRRGADINITDKEGSTFLHIVWMNEDAFSKLFFDLNDEVHQPIKIDAQDNSGDTPLHKALSWERKKLAELLLKRGANMNIANSRGETPLHIICNQYYDVNFVELLLKITDDQHQTLQVDAQDNEGSTPLILALENSQMKVAELLLRRGANPNLANDYGSTPLHVTIQNVSDVSVTMFLKIFFECTDANHQTVQVDTKDHFGQTPLQLAIERLYPDVVDILFDRGADLSGVIFPTYRQFDVGNEPYEDAKNRMQLTSRALAVIERLEKREYELGRSYAVTIMKFFIVYGSNENSADLEKCWRNDERFASEAKNLMINSKLSLYDLMRLRPKVATKLFTYTEYLKFAHSYDYCSLSEPYVDACPAYLCRIMSRGFFRRWAMESFLELTHYKLPILCCENIMDRLINEDLLNICLAAETSQTKGT